MTFNVPVKIGSMESFNLLLQTKPEGVSMRPAGPPPNRGGMTFDDAEYLLRSVVEFSRDLDINLLAAWLVGILVKSGGEKTNIGGHPMPKEKSELVALIKTVISEQPGNEPSVWQFEIYPQKGLKLPGYKRIFVRAWDVEDALEIAHKAVAENPKFPAETSIEGPSIPANDDEKSESGWNGSVKLVEYIPFIDDETDERL